MRVHFRRNPLHQLVWFRVFLQGFIVLQFCLVGCCSGLHLLSVHGLRAKSCVQELLLQYLLILTIHLLEKDRILCFVPLALTAVLWFWGLERLFLVLLFVPLL